MNSKLNINTSAENNAQQIIQEQNNKIVKTKQGQGQSKSQVKDCYACQKAFVPRFSFQAGEHKGEQVHFCSQLCRQAVLTADMVLCESCDNEFIPSLAFQIAENAKGDRVHFCSQNCRHNYYNQAQQNISSATSSMPTINADAAAEAKEKPRHIIQKVNNVDSNRNVNSPMANNSINKQNLAAQQMKSSGKKTKPRVVAVLNQKGGTGKTTTAVGVASGLARVGLKTLLLDFDPQGNVGISLGVKSPRQAHHVLLSETPLNACWIKARENLWIITSDEGLAGADIELARKNQSVRTGVLTKRLANITEFDFIIIDCAPSLSLLNHNALVYAGEVLIPVSCDYLALVGVKQVLKTLRRVGEQTGKPVRVAGVLPTFFDVRNKMCVEVLGYLRKSFGAKTLPPVRRNTKLAEAPSHKRTIFEHAPESNGARDYIRVVEWLRNGMKKGKVIAA